MDILITDFKRYKLMSGAPVMSMYGKIIGTAAICKLTAFKNLPPWLMDNSLINGNTGYYVVVQPIPDVGKIASRYVCVDHVSDSENEDAFDDDSVDDSV